MAAHHEPIYIEENTSHESLNIQGLANALLDKFWIILLCVGAGAFLAVLYAKHAPRTYASRAVILVEQERPKTINIDAVPVENFNAVDFLKTVEQTLQSRSLYERVLTTANLENDPRFVDSSEGKVPRRSALISRLAGMTEARLRPGSRLIDVTVEHTNPEIAQLVAATVVNEFMRENMEQISKAAQVATDFLRAEAARLEQKVLESERALHAYTERTKFVLADQQQNVFVDQLRQQLSMAKADRIRRETEYRQIETHGKDFQALLSVPQVAQDPTVVQLQNSITSQQAEIARLVLRYKPKHPKYIEANSQLAKLQEKLNDTIWQVCKTTRTGYENAKAAESALARQLEKEESDAIDYSKMSIEYGNLARQVESDRAVYQNVLNKMKEADLARQLEFSKIREIQKAEVPEFPIKPQKTMLLILGIAAGGLAGVSLALLLGIMDSSLKSLDEAEKFLKMPVLSSIPRVSASQLSPTQLVMSSKRKLSGAESFRSLRTSLALLPKSSEHRLVLFTSAMPEEGKTFNALNYAHSLAQQGLRVLLIDCDLRRPSVEQSLCGNHGKLAGVTDFLNGQLAFSDATHDTGIPNFMFVPAGTPVSNPAELLAQESVDTLLREALERFDRVVIDSAPIFGVSDSLLLVGKVHVACLVVQVCKTPRRKVARAVHVLKNASTPLAGIILNRVPPNDRRNSDDPYYDYGYSNQSENIVPLARASSSQ